jgi:predicted dehydrogenase
MSAPDPIRVLLLGTSFGGSVHAPGFAGNPAFRLVGVASGRLENAKRVADAFDIPVATDDWKRAIEEVDADLVAVATPADLHYPMARAALERGRHVLCEKPFALNVAQAKDLAALARDHGVVHAVNHEFRHYPARATVTRWIEEGTLGAVEHIVVRSRFPGWARAPQRKLTWLTERQRGGGFLGALGSHHIDALRQWGGPIQRVFCRLRTLASVAPDASPAHRSITADDCFTLLAEFAGGATGVVDLFGGATARRERFEVFGSKDALAVLDGYTVGRPRESGGVEPVAIPADLKHEPTAEIPLLAPFRVKVEMLRAAIQEGARVSPDFEEGVEIQKVLDAARLSDQSGTWVSIGE